MRNKNNRWGLWTAIALTCLMTLGCGLFSRFGFNTTSKATPTPTTINGGGGVLPVSDPCKDLSGTLELQLLIGPSDAVGLKPYTMAEIPFIVKHEGDAFLVEGGGPVQYYEDVLEAEWGSFTVKFEGDTTVSGECVSKDEKGVLNVNLVMNGSQTVEVIVEGVMTTFPWEGTPQLSTSFPIEDGAQQEGEGWVLILHLN
ncbi:MAG: hypothetical protein U9R53_03445 [Chloroflexota bacterium]|nr:hypothetical protein [Chloroflexota bacterium]